MYICHCAKGHKLEDRHYEMITEGNEIRIKHDCGFHIIIGADECEDGYSMYSNDVDEHMNEFRLMKAIVVQPEIVSIKMKCGHVADWRGFSSSNICCSACGWDKNGRNSGNQDAWTEDYDYEKVAS